MFKHWSRVFLGHYHAHQFLDRAGRICYLGSPLQLSFHEAGQSKFIFVFDTETDSLQPICNEHSPQHHVVTYEDLEKMEVGENYYRIITMHNNIDSIEKTAEILGDSAREYTFLEKKENQTPVSEKFKVFNTSVGGALLSEYLSQASVPEELDHTRLLKLGNDLLAQSETIL